ncbi:hypothetical protein CHUAL_004838 [Chamberlinius hualienensis]
MDSVSYRKTNALKEQTGSHCVLLCLPSSEQYDTTACHVSYYNPLNLTTAKPGNYHGSCVTTTDDPDADCIPGVGGVDYPIFSRVPEHTDFDCSLQRFSGLYADPLYSCQVFHFCDLNTHQKHSFLCPNGTVLDQRYSVCVWWYSSLECDNAPNYYQCNENYNATIPPLNIDPVNLPETLANIKNLTELYQDLKKLIELVENSKRVDIPPIVPVQPNRCKPPPNYELGQYPLLTRPTEVFANPCIEDTYVVPPGLPEYDLWASIQDLWASNQDRWGSIQDLWAYRPPYKYPLTYTEPVEDYLPPAISGPEGISYANLNPVLRLFYRLQKTPYPFSN